ncbi:MAG: ZIP family metal transporter [Nocardioides sp.]
MPVSLQAGAWGLLAGSALVLGAGAAWFVQIPRTVVAGVMAFGSGVLISALSFDLMSEAEATGGLLAAALGFALGAALYVALDLLLGRRGAGHRKRSSGAQARESDVPGSGLAIAFGALLDGVPESAALGLTLLDGGAVGVSVLVAIFLSNLPEGLSSTAGMKQAGRSAGYVFSVWTGIAVASGLAGLVGVLLLDGAPLGWVGGINALAAGGILAMIVNTMIPEAFERAHAFSGLICATGFLLAFVIGRV